MSASIDVDTFTEICALLTSQRRLRVTMGSSGRLFSLTAHRGPLDGNDITSWDVSLGDCAVKLLAAVDAHDADGDMVPELESSLAFVAARKKVGT